MIYDKKDTIVSEEKENLVSFCRLFVLFEYATTGNTIYSINELKIFSEFFRSVSRMCTIDKLISDDNLLIEVMPFFDEYDKPKCITVKNEYANLLTMPETNKIFIDIRELMFKNYYQSFYSKKSLKEMSNSMQHNHDILENNAKAERAKQENDDTNIIQ